MFSLKPNNMPQPHMKTSNKVNEHCKLYISKSAHLLQPICTVVSIFVSQLCLPLPIFTYDKSQIIDIAIVKEIYG